MTCTSFTIKRAEARVTFDSQCLRTDHKISIITRTGNKLDDADGWMFLLASYSNLIDVRWSGISEVVITSGWMRS